MEVIFIRTLIVYATKHGATSTFAETLSAILGAEVSRCQLGRERIPPLTDFEQIIIGGSVHMGKIQKAVTKFMIETAAGVYENIDKINQSELGEFATAMTRA